MWGATMLLTYARSCIYDTRYSGQILKRTGTLKQGGNIIPLSIQRGNLQLYIFRGQHITSYILMGGILPPTFVYIRAENWERIFKKTSKTMFYPHKCTIYKARDTKRKKAVQYRYPSRSIFGYRHDAIAIFF